MDVVKLVITLVVMAVLLAIGLLVLGPCSRVTADLTSIKTDVKHLDARANRIETVAAGSCCQVVKGDAVRVDRSGRARLDMGGCNLDIFWDSELTVKGLPLKSSPLCVVSLMSGTIYNSVEREMIVDTEWARITTMGTRFLVYVDPDRRLLWVVVWDGKVRVEAEGRLVVVGADEQTWVEEGSPPEPPQPAMRDRVDRRLPSLSELTDGEIPDLPEPPVREGASDVEEAESVEQPAPAPSLALGQGSDEVYAGACGEPQRVRITAKMEGPQEAIASVEAARLTYGWEGNDVGSVAMERVDDLTFSAEIGPFDYCCGETTLVYTVELLDAAGNVLQSGARRLRLSYCIE